MIRHFLKSQLGRIIKTIRSPQNEAQNITARLNQKQWKGKAKLNHLVIFCNELGALWFYLAANETRAPGLRQDVQKGRR